MHHKNIIIRETLKWLLLAAYLLSISGIITAKGITLYRKRPQQNLAQNIHLHGWQPIKDYPFPSRFQWGVASSDFQIAGSYAGLDKNNQEKHCQNSWTQSKARQPGKSTDHWERYQEDILLIKNIGFNAYRFGIEWSKVNPAQGVFDWDVINHYIDLCKALVKQNIEPIPCLFHHAWPIWFDKLSGFEKKNTIKHFVHYATTIIKAITDAVPEVTMWMTFNEPVGYAMEGWIRGHYPPFKKQEFRLCGKVVHNMLQAHAQVFHKAHALYGKNIQIGFPHIFNPLHSYHSFNPIVDVICARMNYLLHDVALNYVATGHFYWPYIFGAIDTFDQNAVKCVDYIGINYYSNTTMKMSFSQGIHTYLDPKKPRSGDKRAFHPEGLFAAIKQAARVGVPLYITENGVNDSKNSDREMYMRAHIAIIVEALQAGYDIRGYFWWTLIDCFEWSRNSSFVSDAERYNSFSSHMGLYSIDPITKNRVIKPGMEGIVDFIKTVQQKTES